jgi:predicted ester cyclase
MAVMTSEEVGTTQADNMAVVRAFINGGPCPAGTEGNYTAELHRLDDALANIGQEILFMVADGDTVMTRFCLSGDIAETGVGVISTGLMVHRVVDGTVVEAWIDYDRVGVTRTGQLGRRKPVPRRDAARL